MIDFKEQYVQHAFETYFTKLISTIIPNAIQIALKNESVIREQEFVAIKEVARMYNLSLRTLYNYHHRGYITLRTTEGKTFISIIELEEHIRKHPLVRNPW